ncbi:MAG: GTP-binding protein [Thermoplasmata archaeon]|nr:MAG: GTP-binding protein [Thermoplasmata archaeon]
MSEKKQVMRKICLIGEAAVGKTSLIRRFVYDKFEDRYIATIGTKTSAKELIINMDDKKYQLILQIWDIIGLRCFAKLQTRAYTGANGAIFVLDRTRKGTWHAFGNWLLSLYRVTGEIPVIVLANKTDLQSKYDNNEIENYIKKFGFECTFTSAKTGENVDDAFQNLGELMLKPWPKKNLIPTLEKSITMEMEPEMEMERKLSIFEVENIILARYCDLLEDPDIAMSIINEQFRKADVGFMNLSVQRLNMVVENLIKAAMNRVEPVRLKNELKAYSNLIKMIDH